MKRILILAAVAALSGCGDPGSTIPEKFNAALPMELKDCKIHRITDGINSLYITRCPQTTTTSNLGKSGSQVTVDNSPPTASPLSVIDQASVTAAQAEISRANAQLVDVQARIKAAEDALKGVK